ncbi:MAG: hypothetical protein JO210_08035 [Acidobacteriaceae bacterium]|nr:hypothetical protein [Acidobacteriaceae bacterium]
MNSTTKRAVNVAALVAATCLTAFRANAERARFDLPVEAHWGAAILKPGRYTFDVPPASSWPQQIFLTQNGRTIQILPAIESSSAESNRSYLRLVTVKGTYFVREYSSGQSGKSFTFQVPKSNPHELGLNAPGMDIEVAAGFKFLFNLLKQ